MHIVFRYTYDMRPKIRQSEYAALAELRYRIRQFIRGSDDVARAAGLEPQQYELLLAARAFPNRRKASIRYLAERLHLRHHSLVGLVDRLEAHGYVRRQRSGQVVLVRLLPSGQRAVEQVVGKRLDELRESGHALVTSLAKVLKGHGSTRVRPGLRKTSLSRRKKPKRVIGLKPRAARRS